MKNLILSVVIGLLTSVVGSYIYTQLGNSSVSVTKVLPWAAAATLATWLVILALPRIRVGFDSGITAYYPKGQSQYINSLLKDLKKSKTLKVIGARGLDLIGERSPIGGNLQEWPWHGSLEAFLLNADSTHARLRVNHLDVEKQKYQSECHIVDEYLGVLSLRYGINVTTYNYDAEPLFRAVILDNCAYVSLYQSGIQGRLLPCFRLRSVGSPLYKAVTNYCDYLKTMATRRVYERVGGQLPDGRQVLDYPGNTRIPR